MTTIYMSIMNHVKRAGYRPDIITENWVHADKRILFCGNEQDVDECKASGEYAWNIDMVDLGFEISHPSDISLVQNQCFDYCFDSGADWVVYSMADQYLTENGDIVATRFINKPGATFCTFYTLYNQLYVKLMVQYNTLMVHSRQHRIHTSGDGEYVEIDGQKFAHMPINDKLEYVDVGAEYNYNNVLDMGYLGTHQYAAKMFNHNYIWPDAYKTRWLNLYGINPVAAIRMAYQQNDNRPWTPINLEWYRHIIKRLGQMEDYEMCMEVLRNM